MIKTRIAVAGALLAVAGAANAGVSATAAITSDYDFRGLTQTDGDTAGQLGLTINTEGGLYFGTWASNVDFRDSTGDRLDPRWEIDFFAGFAGGDAEESFAYDIGAIAYAYPSSSDFKDVIEVYAGITKGMFGAKAWVSPDNYGDTSFYVESNVAVPLPHDFSLGLHAGYSFGDYWKNSAGEYLDYSVGVTKGLGNFDVNLKYVNSNDYGDAVVGRNAWIATISTTMPWASE
jgi:uncharacterized protein (TIGR02001 family)